MFPHRRTLESKHEFMVDSEGSASCQAVPGQIEAAIRSLEPVDVLTVVRHPIGGIITYLRYVYPHLDRNRFRITIVAPTTHQASTILATIPGVRVILIKSQGSWTLARLFFRVAFSLVSGSYALWHSQGATAGALMGLFSLICRRPHVITFHETFDANSLAKHFSPLMRRMLEFFFARANVINVVSEDARSNLLEYFPKLAAMQERIVVIHNGVDVDYLTAPTPGPETNEELRQRLMIPRNTHILGYLGRFMPEKGFPVLIDAMDILARRSRDTQYVVIAVGSGAYEREYRSRIRTLGLKARFRFIEYQSDVRWLYRQVDAIVIPSLREAFALVAVEALIMGVPVVASSCIGLREVVQGSPAILVEPGNAESLATGIERSTDPELAQMANSYKQTACDTYDSRDTATRLAGLFSKLLVRA